MGVTVRSDFQFPTKESSNIVPIRIRAFRAVSPFIAVCTCNSCSDFHSQAALTARAAALLRHQAVMVRLGTPAFRCDMVWVARNEISCHLLGTSCKFKTARSQ